MNAVCLLFFSFAGGLVEPFSLSSGEALTREAKSSGNSKSSVPAQLSPVMLFPAWTGVVWLLKCELLLSQQEKGNIRNFWQKLLLLSLYRAFYCL